jgi:hypothetical protein
MIPAAVTAVDGALDSAPNCRMRHRDPTTIRREGDDLRPIEGPPAALGHIRSHGVRRLLIYLLHRPQPSQCGHRRRRAAG